MVARDLWGVARTAFNAPSRRKKERQKRLVMSNPSGRGKGLAIPAAEYPAGFVFYKMAQAGLLQGLPSDVDVSGRWKMVVIDDDERRRRFLGKHPAKKLTLHFRHVPQEFGRLLAKIGYGQVLTQLDPWEFRQICVPYILGQKSNVSHIVGGTHDDQAPEPDNGYSLGTTGFGTTEKIILVALVRLLANTHAPAYHVVVGDVTGADRVRNVLKKTGAIIQAVYPMQRGPEDSLPHWSPQVWPPPS